MFGIKKLLSRIDRLEREMLSLHDQERELEEDIRRLQKCLEQDRFDYLAERLPENVERLTSMLNEFKGFVSICRAALNNSQKEQDEVEAGE